MIMSFIKKYAGISAVILTFALVIAVMLAIYSFSAEDREESAKTSGKVVDVVIDVTVPQYETLPTEQKVHVKDKTSFWVRKSAHFTEFACLGFALILHINTLFFVTSDKGFRLGFIRIKQDSGRKKRASCARFGYLVSLGIGIVYAISDEWHQSFVDGRGPMVTDTLIDSCGVICGVFFALALWYFVIARRYKKIGRDM